MMEEVHEAISLSKTDRMLVVTSGDVKEIERVLQMSAFSPFTST
jgi:hypothetical protein